MLLLHQLPLSLYEFIMLSLSLFLSLRGFDLFLLPPLKSVMLSKLLLIPNLMLLVFMLMLLLPMLLSDMLSQRYAVERRRRR